MVRRRIPAWFAAVRARLGILRQRRIRNSTYWYIKLWREEWPELERVRYVRLAIAPRDFSVPPLEVTGVLQQATRNFLEYLIHAEHRPKLDAAFRPGDLVFVVGAEPAAPKRGQRARKVGGALAK
jgi:hypothetical protein